MTATAPDLLWALEENKEAHPRERGTKIERNVSGYSAAMFPPETAGGVTIVPLRMENKLKEQKCCRGIKTDRKKYIYPTTSDKNEKNNTFLTSLNSLQ